MPPNKELQRDAMRRQRCGLSEVYVQFRVAVSGPRDELFRRGVSAQCIDPFAPATDETRDYGNTVASLR